jgi:hypothetical protein
LFTQMLIFFFNRHVCTLLGFATFGKSRANLGSNQSTNLLINLTDYKHKGILDEVYLTTIFCTSLLHLVRNFDARYIYATISF